MKKPKTQQDVEISTGVVRLNRPNAGVRNKSLVKAEHPAPDSAAGSYIKYTVFWIEMLPHAIDNANSPGLDNAVPISQQLDGMSHDDYDKLNVALKDFYNEDEDLKVQLQGESQGQSEQKDSQKTSGSETSSSSTASVPSSASAPTE